MTTPTDPEIDEYMREHYDRTLERYEIGMETPMPMTQKKKLKS